VFET